MSSTRIRHLVSTVLYALAFIACAIGAYSIANTAGDGDADIGAGVLVLFGTVLGILGVISSATALTLFTVTARRARSLDGPA